MKWLLPMLCVRLCHAFMGYIHWHVILQRYKISTECAVILIPSPADEECTEYAVKYVKEFLRCNRYKSVAFVSSYPNLSHLIKKFQVESVVRSTIFLSDRKISQLLDFYNANLNDERLIVASLCVPCGRNALNYMNTGVLSKEEIFVIGIYNITSGPEYEKFAHSCQ